MANNKTDDTENEVITFYLRPGDGAPTRPTALFLALFTSDPGETEVVTGEPLGTDGYARLAIAFSAPSGGATANTGALSFGPATPNGWGSVTHCAIARAATRAVADLLYVMPLTTPQTVLVNQTLDFAIGAVTVAEL